MALVNVMIIVDIVDIELLLNSETPFPYAFSNSATFRITDNLTFTPASSSNWQSVQSRDGRQGVNFLSKLTVFIIHTMFSVIFNV